MYIYKYLNYLKAHMVFFLYFCLSLYIYIIHMYINIFFSLFMSFLLSSSPTISKLFSVSSAPRSYPPHIIYPPHITDRFLLLLKCQLWIRTRLREGVHGVYKRRYYAGKGKDYNDRTLLKANISKRKIDNKLLLLVLYIYQLGS